MECEVIVGITKGDIIKIKSEETEGVQKRRGIMTGII